ncbi:hypothetical protein PENTCL1PPCAC_5164, partial [Pristionchus entomophagus]
RHRGPPVEQAPAARGGHFGGEHLFTITVRMPEGTILQSKMMQPDVFDSEDLAVGSSLLRALHGNCQQFFLSAAINTSRQRLYSRIRTSGRMSHACELQCEFDRAAGVARVSGFALQSAYAPQAGPAYQQLQFITKHASSGALTHIDLSCIPYLGHLPTDMIGRSLFCFVYAPDVHIIRQAHIDLHAGRGRIVRSAASIRFVAFNGALIRADTEWSAYVNPWTRKMELVVARHKLVDAPVGDANVLGVPADGFVSPVLPAPMIRMLEEDLRQIMAKPVGSSQAAAAAAAAANGLPSSSTGLFGLQAKDLSLYVERIVEAIVLNGPAGLEQSVKALREEEQRAAACAAAAASAAAAAVAATNTETSTPPSTTAAQQQQQQQLEQLQQLQLAAANQQLPLPLSYNQINCLENVHRLLKSQAKYEEEGDQEEIQNDLSNLAPSVPLTRETLMEHTRRYEAEYRATWSRRLSGALKRPFAFEPAMLPTTSAEAPAASAAPPAAKQSRPSSGGPPPLEWTPAQREEYYRSQQNPAVPSGMNYQITSMPLPSPATVLAQQQQQAAARRSAFSTVHRAHLDIAQQAKSFGPLTVSTFDPPVSVIKSTEPQGLLLEATKLA